MADLQIHCSLPEAAKHLAPSQIDELVQAMVSCTWDGAYSKVEGVRSKLGDDLASNASAQSHGSAGVVFKISVPADQGIEAGQEIQSVWDKVQKFIQRPISGMDRSPLQGIHLFVMQYRDGNYGTDAKMRSNVKYRVVSGDEAKRRAKTMRPLEFSEGNEYGSALVSFDAPVSSFKHLRLHGVVYCGRCPGGLATFVCDCIGRDSGTNSQPCPTCGKPIHISAEGLDPNDEKCSELWLRAGMTDRPKTEPVRAMAVHGLKQVAINPYGAETAQPLPVKSQRAEKTAAPDPSKASVELNPTLKQLEVKLKQEANPKLPIVRLYVGEWYGDPVIRWHYATGYGDVRLDHDAATQWLAKELSPVGVTIENPRYSAGSPERSLFWSFKMR
jgi:hypothetical protein